MVRQERVAGQTYLGGFGACTREITQGVGVWQKVYAPFVAFFIDAVVFIQPPLKERWAKAGAVILGGAVLGFHADPTQTWHAGHTMAEFAGKGVEEMAEQVNERFRRKGYSIGAAKFTYHDLIAEFGDWADVWPNRHVVKVTMKKRNPVDLFIREGYTKKHFSVKLKPVSGLKREIIISAREADDARVMLADAFQERFIQ